MYLAQLLHCEEAEIAELAAVPGIGEKMAEVIASTLARQVTQKTLIWRQVKFWMLDSTCMMYP
jgi:Holliday junction resolvasome RuvABC DNA-binding subunit